jgi:uncharacterized protein YlxW (UPF0749 family)
MEQSMTEPITPERAQELLVGLDRTDVGRRPWVEAYIQQAAEVERLTRERNENEDRARKHRKTHDAMRGFQTAVRRLEEEVERLQDVADSWCQRAVEAEAEVDEREAQITRLELTAAHEPAVDRG